MDLVGIIDPHASSRSNIRTGDILEDVNKKLTFVVDYCNANDATLMIAGDVFDKNQVLDVVKNRIAANLKRLKYKALVIPGNHDLRYNNPDQLEYTSIGNLIITGVVELLTTIDYEDFRITSVKPLETIGKPQIAMFHGFLNVDDGLNSVYFTDLTTQDPCLCLLGHDHVEYEPLLVGTVKVIRPGSFLRGIRNDTNIREPKMVHMRINKDGVKHKLVPITVGRDCAEIFKTKKVTISKAQQVETYEKIINQIKESQSADMTLKAALELVTTPEVVQFIESVVDSGNLKKQRTK